MEEIHVESICEEGEECRKMETRRWFMSVDVSEAEIHEREVRE